jgi:hypothetical protein
VAKLLGTGNALAPRRVARAFLARTGAFHCLARPLLI